MKNLMLAVVFGTCVTVTGAHAQNWRTPNPNAPNGYRASMASYHYHGSYKEPAQQQNGYRASEARSKAGMSCFTPPSPTESSSERGGGGRFGGSEGRWGSSEGRWGSENQTASLFANRFQNSGSAQGHPGEWNDFYRRRFEQTERGSAYAPENSQVSWGGSQGQNNSEYSPQSENIGRNQAYRAALATYAARRALQNSAGGTFNRTYGSNEGGFNRIYQP